MSDRQAKLSDEVVREICRIPSDDGYSDELVHDLRGVLDLVERPQSRHNGQLQYAVALLTAALAKLPKHHLTHLPFGYTGPRIQSAGWIDREYTETAAKQIVGLLWTEASPEAVAVAVSIAFSDAIRLSLIKEHDYDAWRPGMVSGSAWRSALAATPYGLTKARSMLGATLEQASLVVKATATSAQPQRVEPVRCYLYASTATPSRLTPETVFFQCDDEQVALAIVNLCRKEYGAGGSPIGFYCKPSSDLALADEVLLDEALTRLAAYEDPDPGVYNPPVNPQTLQLAQYARRANGWEQLLRARLRDDRKDQRKMEEGEAPTSGTDPTSATAPLPPENARGEAASIRDSAPAVGVRAAVPVESLAREPKIRATDAQGNQAAQVDDNLREEVRRLNDMERNCIQAIFEKRIIGISVPQLPSQEIISKWAGYSCDTTFKTALSAIVKAGYLDNGKHHGKRGGYFLTAKGERAGQLLVQSSGLIRTDSPSGVRETPTR